MRGLPVSRARSAPPPSSQARPDPRRSRMSLWGRRPRLAPPCGMSAGPHTTRYSRWSTRRIRRGRRPSPAGLPARRVPWPSGRRSGREPAAGDDDAHRCFLGQGERRLVLHVLHAHALGPSDEDSEVFGPSTKSCTSSPRSSASCGGPPPNLRGSQRGRACLLRLHQG